MHPWNKLKYRTKFPPVLLKVKAPLDELLATTSKHKKEVHFRQLSFHKGLIP